MDKCIGGKVMIALDQALTKLRRLDAGAARIVELKMFSILSTDQITAACGSSVATAGRQWRFAKNWPAKELNATPTKYAN
jgi:ECF sigma factor